MADIPLEWPALGGGTEMDGIMELARYWGNGNMGTWNNGIDRMERGLLTRRGAAS